MDHNNSAENPCDPVTTSTTTALATIEQAAELRRPWLNPGGKTTTQVVLRTKRAVPLALPWIAAFVAPLLLELGIHLPLALDESAKTRRWRGGVEKLAKELVAGLERHDSQLKTVSYENFHEK